MNYKELSLDKFMIIAALKSPDTKDLRSVIHPETIGRLLELEGSSVICESGIGQGINVSDEDLTALGLSVFSREECIAKGNLIITPLLLPLLRQTKFSQAHPLLVCSIPFTLRMSSRRWQLQS